MLQKLCLGKMLFSSSAALKKTTQLKQLLHSNKLNFIMEAHNGLSSVIVEEAGFKGIWASGLSISASLGVRDCNEASWTQVVDVLETMSDRTSIPILLDGDTGYGNYNNARRLIKKLEQRNIAGVCLEDKFPFFSEFSNLFFRVFPKRNSLLDDGRQELADINEFARKITACKETQSDDDFQVYFYFLAYSLYCKVVARVEAFIAGWGLKEAIKRAEAYKKAGADAILIHSAKNNPSEIEQFVKEWDNRHPVVIVPTKYYQTPTSQFRDWKIALVIWANHNLRSCVTAMQKTTKTIFETESLVEVEKNVAKVNEIFRLQGEQELKIADKKYL